MRGLVLVAACAFLGPALPALALATPAPGRADPRIRTVDYDPLQVVRVVGVFRTATQILFGPNETILHVAVGDMTGWDVVAERNILFMKPKERRGPTNLIATTSLPGGETRNYTFELTTRDGPSSTSAPDTFFVVRFRYPADEKAALVAVIAAEETALRQKVVELKLDRGVIEGRRNFAYEVEGPASLQPSEVSDNGGFTVMRFPAGQAIPAIYTVTPDGTESLVPFDVRGEFVVIHATGRLFRLRRGREVLCIYNTANDPYGVNLGTHTASPEVDRADKGAAP
jgi:type IV secretion system protein VirB9